MKASKSVINVGFILYPKITKRPRPYAPIKELSKKEIKEYEEARKSPREEADST